MEGWAIYYRRHIVGFTPGERIEVEKLLKYLPYDKKDLVILRISYKYGECVVDRNVKLNKSF